MTSTPRKLMAQKALLSIGVRNAQVSEYRKADGTVRHKCFLSYHAEDAEEVLTFVESFGEIFIPRVIGISEDEPWVGSDNVEYILDKIREDYLSDSTVTIVLVGRCTWARKFVDWEIYSSLRRGKVNRLNGLMAIELPGVADSGRLPDRVRDNIKRDAQGVDIGYARYYAYPGSGSRLRSWIEDSFQARTIRSERIVNSRERRKNNGSC